MRNIHLESVAAILFFSLIALGSGDSAKSSSKKDSAESSSTKSAKELSEDSEKKEPSEAAKDKPGFAAKTAEPSVTATAEKKEPAVANDEKSQRPEFVAKREAACEKYRAESNEIKASKVFSEYIAQAESAGYKVEDFEGTIDEIETTHGGGEVILKIKTSIGDFSSNDILQGHKRSLKKNGKVYNALADMSVGDTVLFSASLIAPEKGFMERQAVCGDDWVALFTSVKKK